MKICAVISEYNPFHLGHSHHLKKTREILGEDTTILSVMSGNYVQRGDFAIAEKYERAKIAVLGGADLVVELPSAYAVSSAEHFACGGVSLLSLMGINGTLSFGCECGDVDAILTVADVLVDPNTNQAISLKMKSGQSYASARQEVVTAMIGKKGDILSTPNNTLAIEYVKAIKKTGSLLSPLGIKREGAAHDSLITDKFVSASLVRNMLYSGDLDAFNFMPKQAVDTVKQLLQSGDMPVRLANAERALIAKLRSMTLEDFLDLPDSGEGLGFRFKNAVRDGRDLQEIAILTKTKRYALSRIRRMIICAYLGINGEMQKALPSYALVLAFSRKGRELLHKLKETSKIPIITRPASIKSENSKAVEDFMFQIRADDLYSIGMSDFSKQQGEKGFKQIPFFYDN